MLIYHEVSPRATLINEKVNFSWKGLGDGSWPFPTDYFFL